jgi:hypothetical protein
VIPTLLLRAFGRVFFCASVVRGGKPARCRTHFRTIGHIEQSRDAACVFTGMGERAAAGRTDFIRSGENSVFKTANGTSIASIPPCK